MWFDAPHYGLGAFEIAASNVPEVFKASFAGRFGTLTSNHVYFPLHTNIFQSFPCVIRLVSYLPHCHWFHFISNGKKINLHNSEFLR